ncbi:hypothetical protein QAD02_001022 [Eretmocerus hayati]|uniref:Uncharacterized protein n=1 Tax=Eretmocerus hayati TaxID=131215 RepID=A0ACC2NFR1_9HYME|nr:hypothetical protein QAD02_001022 [Eretmocerus hayati]
MIPHTLLSCYLILYFTATLGGNFNSRESKSSHLCQVPNEDQCLSDGVMISLEECDNRCRSSNSTFIVRGICFGRCYCEWNILGLSDTDFLYPLEICEAFYMQSLLDSQQETVLVSLSTAATRPGDKLVYTTGKSLQNEHSISNIDKNCLHLCMDYGKNVGKTIMKGLDLWYDNHLKGCICQYDEWGCIVHVEPIHLGSKYDSVVNSPKQNSRWALEEPTPSLYNLPDRPPTPRDPILDSDWPWGNFEDPQPHGNNLKRAQDAALIDAAFEACFEEIIDNTSCLHGEEFLSPGGVIPRSLHLPQIPESVLTGLFEEDEESCIIGRSSSTELHQSISQNNISKPQINNVIITPVRIRENHNNNRNVIRDVHQEVNNRIPSMETGRLSLAPMLLWRSRLMEKPLQPSSRRSAAATALRVNQMRKRGNLYLR